MHIKLDSIQPHHVRAGSGLGYKICGHDDVWDETLTCCDLLQVGHDGGGEPGTGTDLQTAVKSKMIHYCHNPWKKKIIIIIIKTDLLDKSYKFYNPVFFGSKHLQNLLNLM